MTSNFMFLICYYYRGGNGYGMITRALSTLCYLSLIDAALRAYKLILFSAYCYYGCVHKHIYVFNCLFLRGQLEVYETAIMLTEVLLMFTSIFVPEFLYSSCAMHPFIDLLSLYFMVF